MRPRRVHEGAKEGGAGAWSIGRGFESPTGRQTGKFVVSLKRCRSPPDRTGDPKERGRGSLAAISFAVVACVVACSSRSGKLPPVLGNCVPPPDAACASPGGGGGSAAENQGDSGAGTGTGAAPGTCGGAEFLVINTNVYCEPCIVSTCCNSAMSCGATCQSLLACTQKCTQGDLNCVGVCEDDPTLQAGVSAYLDFASCVATCPACPALQHQ